MLFREAQKCSSFLVQEHAISLSLGWLLTKTGYKLIEWILLIEKMTFSLNLYWTFE